MALSADKDRIVFLEEKNRFLVETLEKQKIANYSSDEAKLAIEQQQLDIEVLESCLFDLLGECKKIIEAVDKLVESSKLN